MTVEELFQKYYFGYADFRCRSKQAIQANFRRYFTEIKGIKAVELSPYTVQAWHCALADRHGEITANRSLTLLKTLFNFGDKWELINCRNPAKAVKRFKETPRSRFVTEEEMPLLLNAIETHGTIHTKEIFLLCLWTAQRLQNVCSMEWEEIDFLRRTWTIPAGKFKTGVKHEVPLVEEALEILLRRRNNSPYVFPGRGRRIDSHISYPYTGWRKVLKTAGLKDLHPHDLRRTHATNQNENDCSSFVIRDTLGHTDMQTTSSYARTPIAKIRDAMQSAVRRMKKNA